MCYIVPVTKSKNSKRKPGQERKALIEARERLGMTQVALAEMIGRHRVVIYNVEVGKRNPSLKLMTEWAKAIGQPLDVFSAEYRLGDPLALS